MRAAMAALLASAVAIPHAAPSASAQSMPEKLPIGMNISFPSYWVRDNVFIDLMKSAAMWNTHNLDGSGPYDTGLREQMPADTDGYPLQVPFSVASSAPQKVEAMLPWNYPAGDYLVLYDGEGDFTFGLGARLVRKEREGRLVVNFGAPGGQKNMSILRSSAANHVRNIRIIPPAMESTYQTQIFTPAFLNALKTFHCIRFMDFLATNANPVMYWKDRTTPTKYTQCMPAGVSIEYCIALCNMLKCAGWYCVPAKADDGYIRNFARMVRDGMNPGLKVYLEHSNEMWNWAAAFSQSQWVLTNAPGAADTIRQALAAIDPNGGSHPEKDAYMMQRTSNIWLSEFTGADRSRLVRVAGTQLGWADNTGRILAYLKNHGGCDVIAIAPYFSQASQATFAAGTDAAILTSAAYARQYGVGLVCYEGGLETKDEAYARSEAVYGLYRDFYHQMTLPGVACSLFTALTFVGKPTEWGHLDSCEQAALPGEKWTVMWRSLMDGNTPKPVVGTAQTPGRPTAAAMLRSSSRPQLAVSFAARPQARSAQAFSIQGRALTACEPRRTTAAGLLIGTR